MQMLLDVATGFRAHSGDYPLLYPPHTLSLLLRWRTHTKRTIQFGQAPQQCGSLSADKLHTRINNPSRTPQDTPRLDLITYQLCMSGFSTSFKLKVWEAWTDDAPCWCHTMLMSQLTAAQRNPKVLPISHFSPESFLLLSVFISLHRDTVGVSSPEVLLLLQRAHPVSALSCVSLMLGSAFRFAHVSRRWLSRPFTRSVAWCLWVGIGWGC